MVIWLIFYFYFPVGKMSWINAFFFTLSRNFKKTAVNKNILKPLIKRNTFVSPSNLIIFILCGYVLFNVYLKLTCFHAYL